MCGHGDRRLLTAVEVCPSVQPNGTAASGTKSALHHQESFCHSLHITNAAPRAPPVTGRVQKQTKRYREMLLS